MKRFFSLALFSALTLFAASASSTIDLRGTEYTVDTLFHAPVGPGTTQTQLHLSGPNPLQVFYLTVDISTPGVSIRTVCATDHVAGTARTSAMAKANSKDGLLYFAGTNGDFYSTSGTATNGSSVVGTPTTATIVNGEIYKSSNSNYQFTVDNNGIPYVSRLNFYTGTATCGDKNTLFKGVNVSSPNNGITLYTPRYWGSANQTDYADACWQVTARLMEGDSFTAGSTFRLVVTSEPNATGDTPIPDDGFVIHGRGSSTTDCNTSAYDFVGALHTGDIVTINNRILTAEGQEIHPFSTVSGNPKNVGGGETLDTEGERGDASSRHPRTCIGYSHDHKKVIMMVIDGRSASSAGVTTSMLADVMRYAGAYEAVNIDGGGSSTLYVEALGVRNRTSDGQERAVGNAVFAVLEAPEDNEVASLAFVDWEKKLPFLGIYTPTVYAFNKYGKLIDTDYKDYTLSCPPELGVISDDGKSLIASGSGMHALHASTPAGTGTTAIPVYIIPDLDITPLYETVIIDNSRQWYAQIKSEINGTSMPIDPKALSWTSDNPDIVEITADGLAKGIAEGTAVITGVRDNTEVKINVSVQIPQKNIDAMRPMVLENWKVSKSGLASIEPVIIENGFAADFVQSGRGPSFTFTNKGPIYSLPRALRIRINPGETPLASFVLKIRANNQLRPIPLTVTDLKPSVENVFTYPVDEYFDTDDIGIYPLEFQSLAITPAGSNGVTYHVDIPGIEAVYTDDASVSDITANDGGALTFSVSGDIVTFTAEVTNLMVTDTAGRAVHTADGPVTSFSTAGLTPGIYIISANTPAPKAAKITLP